MRVELIAYTQQNPFLNPEAPPLRRFATIWGRAPTRSTIEYAVVPAIAAPPHGHIAGVHAACAGEGRDIIEYRS